MTSVNKVDPNIALKLANDALDAQNFAEAHHYFGSVLEIDPDNVEAVLGKGLAAGWQSNLIRLRLEETMAAFRRVGELAGKESNIYKAMALQVYEILSAVDRLSTEHTMQFVRVDAARYEAFDRAEEVIHALDEVLQALPEMSDLVVPFMRRVLNAQINTSGCMGDQLQRFKSRLRLLDATHPETKPVAKPKSGESEPTSFKFKVGMGAALLALTVGALQIIQPTTTLGWVMVVGLVLFIGPLVIAGCTFLLATVVMRRRAQVQQNAKTKSPGQV